MTSNLPVPPTTAADARNRAARTFMTGMLTAVLASALPVILAMTGQIQWTREWWLTEAGAVGLVAIHAAVAYVARYTHPPAP